MFNSRDYAGTGFHGGKCDICHQHVPILASAFKVCPACLKRFPGEAWTHVALVHRLAREGYGLPVEVPHAKIGIRCTLCLHECLIPEGELGFCGLRENKKGKMVVNAGNPSRGRFKEYLNVDVFKCVAGMVCPEVSQEGRKSLSVFYGSCTFNCLFCQNWNYRIMRSKATSATDLAAVVDAETACVCFIGGDPGSQMPHALATARQLIGKGVRVCWETNGGMHSRLLEKAVRISLATGGCIKFDLKAWNEYLHRALTGVDNRRTLDNFKRAASLMPQRSESPLLVASTLLVPGYVDAEEVFQIARFIYQVNPRIPYILLGFAPQFHFSDLPSTSIRHAREAKDAAHAAGLQNVHLANEHLLTRAY